MKYIEFDAKGSLVGRYDSSIHGAAVPAEAIEVSEEVFWKTIREKDVAWNLAAGKVVSVALPARPIDEVRAEKWAEVKRERDRRCAESGYKVSGKWFHSDQQSRIQQLGLVLLGASIPPGTQWKTMDGSFVAMTPTLAQQILASAAASDQAIFSAGETHRAAIESSPDPEEYDVTSGWPLAFAG